MSSLKDINLFYSHGMRSLDEVHHFLILAQYEGRTFDELTDIYRHHGKIKSCDWVRVLTKKLGHGLSGRYPGLRLIDSFDGESDSAGPPKQLHYLSKRGKKLYGKITGEAGCAL